MGPSPKKYYPGDHPVGDAQAFVKALESAGLKADGDYKYLELTDGEHTESSWQTRVDQVLLFLYGTGGASPTTSVARQTR